ncbi:MAG TPA: hypothetical protein GX747_03615 [Tenericutes bacterium]|nr:hypothetical protein [Mycoplasmatota bacterium]
MNKIKHFTKELNFIKNNRYKESAEVLLELLPDYFFHIPASSTGKYHPNFSLGEKGLVRHTKVAIRIAYELLCNNTIGNIFNQDEKDLMLIAIMLHDGCKLGVEQTAYTVVDHPIIISEYIKENSTKTKFTASEIEFICSCIETHMGEWNTDYKGNKVLEKPSNKYQKFVHMCDFLSSKKFLDIKFENDEIIE